MIDNSAFNGFFVLGFVLIEGKIHEVRWIEGRESKRSWKKDKKTIISIYGTRFSSNKFFKFKKKVIQGSFVIFHLLPYPRYL